MISVGKFCKKLSKYDFGPYIGVPCSILEPITNYIFDNDYKNYYAATSEGEAMGIAAGFTLSGKLPVVFMQNSGLGNAVNPITSLQLVYDLPVLILVSWRGEPGKHDEPEHMMMGPITPKLLDLMGLYSECLVESGKELEKQIIRIKNRITKTNKPSALIIKKDSFEKYIIKSEELSKKSLMQRKEAIRIIVENLKGNEVIVSTTGKISRELYCNGKETKTNFYVVGSMGCALSIGFGIAQEKLEKKVIVLDGDGAVLMKMGTLALIGHYRPRNLIHIVLDNESYDSTGGQSCISETIELDKVALSSGYLKSVKVYTGDELKKCIKKVLKSKGPYFILVKVLKGADKNLGRPQLTSLQIKKRFMNFLKE